MTIVLETYISDVKRAEFRALGVEETSVAEVLPSSGCTLEMVREIDWSPALEHKSSPHFILNCCTDMHRALWKPMSRFG